MEILVDSDKVKYTLKMCGCRKSDPVRVTLHESLDKNIYTGRCVLCEKRHFEKVGD